MANKECDTYVMGGARFVIHMLFIDDILLFARATMKMMKTIRRIIGQLLSLSGLSVNNSKSKANFSKVTDRNYYMSWALRRVCCLLNI